MEGHLAQLGLTLAAACLGGGIGSLITLNVLKEKVRNLEARFGNLEQSVVYKDTCQECKNNWTGQIKEMKDDIKSICDKLDRLLERLK